MYAYLPVYIFIHVIIIACIQLLVSATEVVNYQTVSHVTVLLFKDDKKDLAQASQSILPYRFAVQLLTNFSLQNKVKLL